MRVMKSLFFSRFLLALFLILALFSFWTVIRFHEKPARDKDEKAEKGPSDRDNDALYPKLWQEMFMRGRRTRDGRPAAAHRLEAKVQAGKLPLARSGYNPPAFSFKPFSGSPPGPSCDWTELGPYPEDDSVDNNTAYVYGDVSGRVTSMVVDLADDSTGNTLYVGTAYGGLWKTTNGLSGSPTYSFISDPTQSLAMGSVALAPSGGQTLYVGTGELNMAGDSYYGVGILESTNGGSSWTLSSTANSGAISFLGLACSKILVDPTAPATVMAAMGFSCCHPGLTNLNQGLYRSTDSGSTWNQVTTVNGGGQAISGHSFTDIIYDGSATFYSAVRFQGVYVSVDHGASWTQLTTPFPSGTAPNTTNFARATLASRGTTLWCIVADSSDNPSTPGTGDTGLSQSTDSGHTWTAVSLPNSVFGTSGDVQGTYDQYVAAPPGSSSLLVAGIDLFKTSSVNGTSTSWTNLTNAYGSNPTSHPDQHAIAFANAVTWYFGNDGGVWSTQNSGGSINNLNTNIDTIQFYSVSEDPSGVGKFIGGSQDNGTALNHGNSGSVWTELYGGDGGYTSDNPSVSGQFYTENFNVSLQRTDNFGSDDFSNTVIDGFYAPISLDSAAALVPYQVLPGSPVSLILGTSRVWKGPGVTSSDGSGWVTISNNLDGSGGNILALAAAPSNSSYYYATTTDNNTTPAYHVFSNNGGSTWSNVTGTLPTTDPIQGLAIDPTSPATVYLGVQGFVGSLGSGHVFQSTNSGSTWTDITGNLPDAPVNWILVDPHFPGDIYVADDVGVFVTQSVNGSSTSWAQMGTQLPDSTVLQIQFSTTCPRKIVAATHGRGAWSICPLATCPPTPTPTSTPTVTPTFTPCGWPGNTCTPTATPPSAFSVVAAPNVTNGQTPVTFAVELPSPSQITLSVFDIAGEQVYTSSTNGSAGLNSLPWPPKNQDGEPLASGIYIYVIQANGNQKMGKVYVHH